MRTARDKRGTLSDETAYFSEVGAATLAAPATVLAAPERTLTFVPHADLVSLDPVWTTADITRNFATAVYDTLYGYDEQFAAQPQMVEGHRIGNGGLQ